MNIAERDQCGLAARAPIAFASQLLPDGRSAWAVSGSSGVYDPLSSLPVPSGSMNAT